MTPLTPGIHHQEHKNYKAQQQQDDQPRFIFPELREAPEQLFKVHPPPTYTSRLANQNRIRLMNEDWRCAEDGEPLTLRPHDSNKPSFPYSGLPAHRGSRTGI